MRFSQNRVRSDRHPGTPEEDEDYENVGRRGMDDLQHGGDRAKALEKITQIRRQSRPKDNEDTKPSKNKAAMTASGVVPDMSRRVGVLGP